MRREKIYVMVRYFDDVFFREAVHLGIRTVCPLCEKPVTRLDLHVSNSDH